MRLTEARFRQIIREEIEEARRLVRPGPAAEDPFDAMLADPEISMEPLLQSLRDDQLEHWLSFVYDGMAGVGADLMNKLSREQLITLYRDELLEFMDEWQLYDSTSEDFTASMNHAFGEGVIREADDLDDLLDAPSDELLGKGQYIEIDMYAEAQPDGSWTAQQKEIQDVSWDMLVDKVVYTLVNFTQQQEPDIDGDDAGSWVVPEDDRFAGHVFGTPGLQLNNFTWLLSEIENELGLELRRRGLKMERGVYDERIDNDVILLTPST